jgi:small-conductance mechanosensitive channel
MILVDILQMPTFSGVTNFPVLLREWREDTMNFLRHDAPKIVLVLIASYVLTRLLRSISRKSAEMHVRKLPPGVSVQQFRTVTSVITSVGAFVISFVAALEILSLLGLNLGPMLASAGIAGLAIGFGAQTLVHDFINGFFILLENQYDIGDTVRIAGVKGTVERMSLRMTVLRDEDGGWPSPTTSRVTRLSSCCRKLAKQSGMILLSRKILSAIFRSQESIASEMARLNI